MEKRLSQEELKEIEKILPMLVLKEHKTAKEIMSETGISETTLFRRLKKLGIKIPNYHNQLKFNNTVFDCIDTSEKAYWLGFIYADGSINKNHNTVSVKLSIKDIEHLKKYNLFLENTKNVREFVVRTSGKEYSSCDVSVCNKHFKERLMELGVVPNKSLILTFPNLSVFKDRNLVYDFIRGYIDGDGCLTYSHNGRLQMNILGTKEFLEGIMSIFPNKFTINKIKRLKTNVWSLRNCGENADFVCTKLYKKANIYLERKYKRFVALVRNN